MQIQSYKKLLFGIITLLTVTGCSTNEQSVQQQPVTTQEKTQPISHSNPNNEIVSGQIDSDMSNGNPVVEPIINKNDYNYGEYFAYPYVSDGEAMIEPGVGGILTKYQGCLVVDGSNNELVPVFPDSITRWDEKTQSIYMGYKQILLNQPFNARGNVISLDQLDEGLDYFSQVDDLTCLEGRDLMFIW